MKIIQSQSGGYPWLLCSQTFLVVTKLEYQRQGAGQHRQVVGVCFELHSFFFLFTDDVSNLNQLLRPAALRQFQLEEKIRGALLAPIDERHRASAPILFQAENALLGISSLSCTSALFYAFVFEVQLQDTTYECIR